MGRTACSETSVANYALAEVLRLQLVLGFQCRGSPFSGSYFASYRAERLKSQAKYRAIKNWRANRYITLITVRNCGLKFKYSLFFPQTFHRTHSEMNNTNIKQDRQCTCTVTLRRVRATIVGVEQQ